MIRSYHRDLQWLRYCVRSVDRFCAGFRRVIIAVPASCKERLARAAMVGTEAVFCPDYRNDYLGQQVTKLYADTLTDADWVVHVDSDCVFRRPVRATEFVVGGRPEVLITPGVAFPAGLPWRQATERALGFQVGFDYMRRQPLVYPRWLYAEARARIREVHGCEAAEYVLAQTPTGFSEFNALGAVAHRFYPSHFCWREWVSAAYDESYCRINWSWGGLSDSIRTELEAILAGSLDEPLAG